MGTMTGTPDLAAASNAQDSSRGLRVGASTKMKRPACVRTKASNCLSLAATVTTAEAESNGGRAAGMIDARRVWKVGNQAAEKEFARFQTGRIVIAEVGQKQGKSLGGRQAGVAGRAQNVAKQHHPIGKKVSTQIIDRHVSRIQKEDDDIRARSPRVQSAHSVIPIQIRSLLDDATADGVIWGQRFLERGEVDSVEQPGVAYDQNVRGAPGSMTDGQRRAIFESYAALDFADSRQTNAYDQFDGAQQSRHHAEEERTERAEVAGGFPARGRCGSCHSCSALRQN